LVVDYEPPVVTVGAAEVASHCEKDCSYPVWEIY
jgi:hypothetical protein